MYMILRRVNKLILKKTGGIYKKCRWSRIHKAIKIGVLALLIAILALSITIAFCNRRKRKP